MASVFAMLLWIAVGTGIVLAVRARVSAFRGRPVESPDGQRIVGTVMAVATLFAISTLDTASLSVSSPLAAHRAAMFVAMGALMVWVIVRWFSWRRRGSASGDGPVPGKPPPPAGWYDDPDGVARLRWFDGRRWTAHTSD